MGWTITTAAGTGLQGNAGDGGKATAAALRAVADALVVPRRAVTLVRGATTRRKLIEVAEEGRHGSHVPLKTRLDRLLGAA